MPLPLTTLATLPRDLLSQTFKDPRSLLAFERFQLYVAQVIPETFTAFQNLNFVVTAADPTIPNAHVITAGANISVTTATGLVTIKATPSGPSGQIQYNNAGTFGSFVVSGDATLNTTTGILTIANGAVSYAKMQNTSAASVLLGRGASSGAGVVQEITLGSGVSMAGTVLSATGSGGTVTSVSSANTDLTVATGTTTPVLTINSAPKWTTARTVAMSGDVVWSVSLDGSVNVTAGGTIQANAVTTSKINNGAVTEAKITLANNTTNDVSTSAHGFAPILPNDATKYLDGTGGYSVPAGSGVASPFFSPQGRLTLVTGVPVMTSDQTAKGTIYWTPYVSNQAPIYNGSSWTILAATADITYALNATPHTSGNLYDLFLYNSSGSLALGTSPAWTNSTTRSNAIAMKSGIWTNNASIVLTVSGGGSTTTIAANQATYVGTFYATANGQTSQQFQPAPAAGGSSPVVGLFNAYNTVPVVISCYDSNLSWTYNVATWRPADNSSSYRISIVDGLGLSTILASYTTYAGVNAGQASIAVNRNSTSAQPTNSASHSNTDGSLFAQQRFAPALGLSYYQAMEIANAGAPTFYGLLSPFGQLGNLSASLNN